MSNWHNVISTDCGIHPLLNCRRQPNGLTPFGTIDVTTNAATPFIPGTTDLGAAGITDAYENLAFPYDGVDGLDITALVE